MTRPLELKAENVANKIKVSEDYLPNSFTSLECNSLIQLSCDKNRVNVSAKNHNYWLSLILLFYAYVGRKPTCNTPEHDYVTRSKLTPLSLVCEIFLKPLVPSCCFHVGILFIFDALGTCARLINL